MSKRVFTTYQLADLLGATPGTVVEWMQKGWLPYERAADGPVHITEEGLMRFLHDQGVNTEQVMAAASREGASSLADDLAAESDSAESPSDLVAESDSAESPSDLVAESDSTEGPSDLMAESDSAEGPSDLVTESDSTESPSDLAAGVAVEEPSPPPRPGEGARATVEDEPAAAGPAEQVAEATLKWALERNAGEIHLEPGSDGLALRVRIDGVLHERPSFRQRLPEGVGPRLMVHLKALAGLDIAQAAGGQAGKFTIGIEGRQVEAELSTCPTLHGEKVFIRILDRTIAQLGQLGLSGPDEAAVRAALAGQVGLIVLAGGPRSGKGDTLRAMLAAQAGAESNTLLIEAGTDVELEWVTHCPVGPGAHFTPAQAVGAAARQRPEVIAIADLHDPQTAAAALEAAVAGSMVLACVRAPGPAAAVAALLGEMGLQPWPLASTLSLVMGQQTVRLLCEHCKQQAAADASTVERLGGEPGRVDFPVFNTIGCSECGNIGYAGTTGLFSLMRMDAPVVAAIRAGGDAAAIEHAARQVNTSSLLEAALEKARAGQTSLAEAARVLAP